MARFKSQRNSQANSSKARSPSKREARRAALEQQCNQAHAAHEGPVVSKVDRSPIVPRNDSQRRYLDAIEHFQLVFAEGPAGVGKTWVIGAKAAQALDEKRIERIVITRPMVDADEDIGYLPGDEAEKFAPFFAPFREVLEERLGVSFVEYLIKTKRIVIAPLAFMRGRTFKNAIVVLDEAQNTTPKQMKLFLTRIGEGSSVIVNGDVTQKDIEGPSGLDDAIHRISHIPAVKVVRFSQADVVRSPLVAEIVAAYEQPAPVPAAA